MLNNTHEEVMVCLGHQLDTQSKGKGAIVLL